MYMRTGDRLCGLVVRVPGYRSRGPRFRFPVLPDFLKRSGSERSTLSLVSTIEELLGRNSYGSGLENQEYCRGDPLCWPCNTLCPQKLAPTSPTSGNLLVGIVRSRTKATELVCCFVFDTQLARTLKNTTCFVWGHAVAWWLRHYATNRKVAGSIPDEVNF
jgi:hypothetical protein